MKGSCKEREERKWGIRVSSSTPFPRQNYIYIWVGRDGYIYPPLPTYILSSVCADNKYSMCSPGVKGWKSACNPYWWAYSEYGVVFNLPPEHISLSIYWHVFKIHVILINIFLKKIHMLYSKCMWFWIHVRLIYYIFAPHKNKFIYVCLSAC